MTVISAISLVVAVPGPAHAQNADAMKLFKEAKALEATGNIPEACAKFEEANRLQPNAGTLIQIGSCKEKLDKLASALVAFQAALARVKSPQKKATATAHVTALEPRVSQLTISVAPPSRVAGLTVLRDGQPIDPADFDRAIPIDGGSYQITAHASGYQPWATTIQVAPERDLVSVTVPRLNQIRAHASGYQPWATTIQVAPARNLSSVTVPGLVEEVDAERADPVELIERAEVKDDEVLDERERRKDGMSSVRLPTTAHDVAIESPGPRRQDTAAIVRSIPEDPPMEKRSARAALQTLGWGLTIVGASSITYSVLRAATGTLSDDKSAGHITGAVGLASGLLAVPVMYFAYRSERKPAPRRAAAADRAGRTLAVMPVMGPAGGGANLRFTW